MANKNAKLDDKKWQAFLRKIKGKLNTDALEKVSSPIVYTDVIKHFEQERGFKGKWKRWSIGYAKHMAKKGKSGNKVLQDTGRLRNSFLPTNNRVSKKAILWFNAAKTKNGFPYAAAHDIGGPQLPQRSHMWLSKTALDKISNSYLKFISEK